MLVRWEPQEPFTHIVKDKSLTFCPEQCLSHVSGAKDL